MYRYREKSSLECNTDIELYLIVYTTLSLTGATHVLVTIAKIMCSAPPEPIVESMGSKEKICENRGGSKSGTNSLSVEGLSQELIINWNSPI